MEPFSMTVYIGNEAAGVRAYDANYRNNIYLSLHDLSYALSGTEKQFSFEYGKTPQDGEYHAITTGQPFKAENNGITQDPLEAREDVWLAFKRNRIFLNGADRKYYTYREGGFDLYISLTDLQLMLDLNLQLLSHDSLRIDTTASFTPDYSFLQEEGFFDAVNSFVLGDADTNTVLWALDPNEPVSIASISKLMTYLLVCEAHERGELSFEEPVLISEHASEVSQSSDGIISMEPGQSTTVIELLNAMLVASSNESAVALAERVAGTEEQFVARMNERAAQLGLTTAKFYSPNGLPVYTLSAQPAKLQNQMSAYELFQFSSYVLKKYPEITEITSQAYASMPSLEYITANSNPLIFNLPGISGLKTGSTNRAGYCLSASMPVTVNGETHDIILVLLGSENGADRGQQAELLFRCAESFFRANGFVTGVQKGR